jgi:hypothetical protein
LLGERRMKPIQLSMLLCAACGSSDSPPGGDGGPTEQCEPADQTLELATDKNWVLRGIAADRKPWALLIEEATDNSNVGNLVIAEADGMGATLVTGIPNATQIDAAPVVFEGKRCAVYKPFGQDMRFACEGGLDEDTTIDADARSGELVVVDDAGTVRVFAERFAAYTELRRSSAGAWTEVEKFESSISSAEDAVRFDGRIVTCFLAFDDHPGMDIDGDTHTAPEQAQWCRLIPGSQLGVLTDLGLTTFTSRAFGSWTPTAVTARPIAVGGGDTPFALVAAGAEILKQPLPSGTPEPIAPLAGSLTRALIDGERITLVAVTSTQLVTTTRCR